MTHASLFSGIGGPEVAAAMMGWTNVFHCEINPFGRSILEYWFPESESYEDITKTDFTKHRGQIDVLTGGFPCQPFSYAGKQGGQADDRYLWPEMLRVIDEIRPTWVVGENVAGIATMVESFEVTEMGSSASLFDKGNRIHRHRSEQTFTIERICRDLESKGYTVQPVLVPACAVGASHRRDRVFIIAYNAADPDHNSDVRKSAKHDSESREERLQERHKVQFAGKSDNVRSKTVGFSSDSSSKGLEGKDESGSHEEGKRMFIRRDFTGCRGPNGEGLRPEERWQAFPNVSLVHRGNDGLPFDVDNLTIPFAKWRSESLKAYGNAIVPQVMYRIFQCIEEIEAHEKNRSHRC